MFHEYGEFDALGLADLVRRGEVTPAEMIDSAIQRIELLNAELNFVIHRTYDQARAAASEIRPEAPFGGVPFLLKDLTLSLAGTPLQSGSRSRRWRMSAHDSELVRRHKAAGLLILGKTNTPEFGLAPTTEPELHGATHNPWDPQRTSGGSSGGSAVAVAVGAVPMAHANDGGGSIRIPASACGIFGLKPTRARTPLGPDLAEAWLGLSVDHAVTRSVRDSAALLDATHGSDPGAPYWAPPVERPYLQESVTEPGRLRVAFTAEPLLGEVMDSECVAAVRAAAELCESLGHDVVETVPPLDKDALISAFITIVAASTGHEVLESARLSGKKARADEYELITWLLKLIGERTGADQLAGAMHAAGTAGRTMASFFESHDVLLTPTLARPPWPLGDLEPSDGELRALKAARAVPAKPILNALVKQLSGEVLKPMPNTVIFNMTGQPAMSVPLHWTGDGLPVGVQFAAGFGDEATLFRLAGQLEQASPWADRRPPV